MQAGEGGQLFSTLLMTAKWFGWIFIQIATSSTHSYIDSGNAAILGETESCDVEPGSGLELLKNIREDFTITEKATIRAFSWLNS